MALISKINSVVSSLTQGASNFKNHQHQEKLPAEALKLIKIRGNVLSDSLERELAAIMHH